MKTVEGGGQLLFGNVNLHFPYITGVKTPLFKTWFIINEEVNTVI